MMFFKSRYVKKLYLFFGIFTLLCLPALGLAQKHNIDSENISISSSRQTAITQAVKVVSPAVVGINVTSGYYTRRTPFTDDPYLRFFFRESPQFKQVKSLGSGFIINKNGYILTNQHVVKDAIEINVTMVGGEHIKAELIGSDYTTDVAVLKIDKKNLPFVKLGDSDDILIGEWAIALGNPFGLFDISQTPTVTIGVVSAKDQDFGKQQNERIYDGMIQTDAAINSGNSGGPLVNSVGEVIGINTWIISGSESTSQNIGLGFAIPINSVKRVLDDLINYGHVDRSYWTGIRYDELTPGVARFLGLQTAYGVIITDIDKDSPADKAGLNIYDIILSINENEIGTIRDLEQVVDSSDLKAGDILELKIYRDKSIYRKRLRLEPYPQNQHGTNR